MFVTSIVNKTVK